MIENEAVGDVRAAVYVQNQRIFFMRIEVGRLLQPSLDAFSIEAIVPNLFRLGEIQFGEQLIVDVCQLFGRRTRRCAVEDKNIVNARWC